MSMLILTISFDHFWFALIHGPNKPGSYAILLFTASDFASITSQIHKWVLFLLWLLIAKFRFKLKKVGKTTRPFRYDLNQISYDYTVEVRNRLKGLDLIGCLMNYVQRLMTLYRSQWSRASPRKRNAKNKMAIWGGLTNSCEKKRTEKQRRKGKTYPFECRVPKNSKECYSSVINAKK